MSKNLLVFGGAGYLGQNICKIASLNGWKVTSISRSGSPAFKNTIPSWATKIRWEQADLFQPESYTHLLNNATAVIHSVGAFLEGSYKDQVRNNQYFSLLKSAINSKLNPTPNEVYRKMNYESFKVLMDALNSQKPQMIHEKPVVGYISAQSILPIEINPNYLYTKRAAEQYLLTKSFPNFKPMIFQPGLMYSDQRPITLPLAGALSAANTVQNLLCSNSKLVSKPLHVQQVAEGIVKAIDLSLTNDPTLIDPTQAPIYDADRLLKISS